MEQTLSLHPYVKPKMLFAIRKLRVQLNKNSFVKWDLSGNLMDRANNDSSGGMVFLIMCMHVCLYVGMCIQVQVPIKASRGYWVLLEQRL